MTIATAPLSTKVGRSRLQEPLFAWLEPTTPKRVMEVPEPEPVKQKQAPEPEQKAALPPETPADEEEAPDLSHVWVVAAEVEVTPKIASIADHRGSFKAPEGLRVDALEVYCKGCRRPYDEVTGQDCAAQIDNRHLIGGDQSRRAKRKIPTPPPSSKIIPGGRIHRRGIDAYMSGVSRPPR